MAVWLVVQNSFLFFRMSGQDSEAVDYGGTTVSIDASMVTGLANVTDVHVDGTTAMIQGNNVMMFLLWVFKEIFVL